MLNKWFVSFLLSLHEYEESLIAYLIIICLALVIILLVVILGSINHANSMY